ncbi:MAG TPA: hypothetical protein VM260_27965 [Pirellula sp.]|nr:hypothetical protein [Pirellula sp.]
MTSILRPDGDFDDAISPEAMESLEATIRAAGKYVIPSDNLRPHTLEAAREYDSDRRGTYQFARFVLAIAVCGCISLPVLDRLASWREKIASPTSLQIEEIALKRNVGIDWGLFEVFSELRQNQAKSFGQVTTNNFQD